MIYILCGDQLLGFWVDWELIGVSKMNDYERSAGTTGEEGWLARVRSSVFMGVPTFQALDMSAFHSAQGRGRYDCSRSAQGGYDCKN